MNYAFIKNNICINVVVFETEDKANSFKTTMKRDGLVDDIIICPDGFGIGDTYTNGDWTKVNQIPIPTIEERLKATEKAINSILGL